MPFVATAEVRSFTRAAVRLGVTPSAISKAISKLESELGVRLLHRTPRTVALTHEGELFYRECQSALANLRNARDGVSTAQRQPQGTLRVSLPLGLGEVVFMPALPKLLSRYPGLSLQASLTDRNVDLVGEKYDAVVRIGNHTAPGLVKRDLPSVRWATVASPLYLARRGVPENPQALASHNCLRLLIHKGPPQTWSFAAPRGKAQQLETAGNLTSDHPGGLLQAALAGLGVIQVHHYIVAGSLAEGRLVEVLANHAPPPLPMQLLFRNGQARTANSQAFTQLVNELLAPARNGFS